MINRRNSTLKLILSIVIIAIIFVILVPTVNQWHSIIPQIRHCHIEWIVAAVFCQFGVYFFLGLILHAGLNIYKSRISIPYLIYISFVFLFANRAMPGPALAGLASCIYLLKRRNVKGDIGQAVAGNFYIADYASFIMLGIVSFALIRHAASYRIIIYAAGSIILAGAILFYYLLKSQERLIKAIARIINIRHRSANQTSIDPEQINQFVSRIYDKWQHLINDRQSLSLSVLFGFLMHLCEVLTIVCLARSFTLNANPLGVSCAYVIANLSAIVSILPGGLGLFEAGMAATMHRLGYIPIENAVVITILYRLLSVWLPLPLVLGTVRSAIASMKAGRNN